MSGLSWYEVVPPRGCSLAEATAVLRVLAGRGRQGIWRTTPVVALECWVEHRNVRWLIGMDQRLASTLPGQLTAQLSGLDLVRTPTLRRSVPRSAMTVRSTGLASPLKVDNAVAVASACLHIAEALGKRESVVLQVVVGPAAPRQAPPSQFTVGEALGLRSPRKPDAGEQRAWRAKVEEPLFAVQGRVGTICRQTTRANQLLKLAVNALGLANGPQARIVSGRASLATAERLIAVSGPGRTWSSIMNTTELAMLASWPLAGVTVPGHPAAQLGRAPAALLLPADTGSDVITDRIVGASLHPADAGRLVTMPTTSAPYHLHVIGPTGSGKSNLAADLALDDATAGHSLLIIEPKGDLVRDVLARLPEHRHHQVVVIEPSASGSDPVVGFNPLVGPPNEAERRADELLHLFKALFGTAIGPRSSDVLLHALVTAARLPDGSLCDLPVLLTNQQFRRHALSKVTDPLVLAPFWAQFDAFSDGERTQVVAPVLNKLRTFLSRTAVRHLLGQAAPRFSLDELFSRPRIVLVSLNKGLLGPETARLLGSLLLTQCWQAIQRRAMGQASKRRPVMITIDEWQDYTGALDFGDVLAQARGLGVGFTLAHQHLDQLSPSLAAACLSNARSRIAFRPAQKDAKTLAGVLGGGLTPADLDQLGAYEACARLLVDAVPSPPFGVRTLPLPPATQNAAMLRQVSQERYGVNPITLDDALVRRWQGSDSQPEGTVGVTRRRPS